MCLLDRVVEWTDLHIVCEAVNHRAPDHPLRAAGRLGAAVGVEYAAQAMAVHGALMAATLEAGPKQGYLTSVRSLTLHVDRLDDLAGPLRISAERLSGDERLMLYQFQIDHHGYCLLDGRASVVLDALAL
jgi:predicted hotdog family 3-hydroxylacyl-ACP dehydratase